MNNAFDLVSNVDFKEIHNQMRRLITGLHIGKGQNSLEIGGVDNSVIRSFKALYTGSSLKANALINGIFRRKIKRRPDYHSW